MTDDEIQMLKHIRIKMEKSYEVDPDFDGYVKINPDICERVTGLNFRDQQKALKALFNLGKIDGEIDRGFAYVKALKMSPPERAEYHKPRDEAERKFMKLAYHPPTYQHGKTVYDYRVEADQNFKDPEWWSR